ncbi:hypothetical protein [Streptomyces sp. NPDC127066]|uniref:hypothetical protein n=1 Tax=Streptomyces sp. NPDC127066 TaxID=3347125 RepID=UPI00365B7DB6
MEQASDGWRDEYETHPEYRAILDRMAMPWWQRPVVLLGTAIALVVASFCLGITIGDSGSDSLTPAEAGRADAQAMYRNHIQGHDVSIRDNSPVFVCRMAGSGVGLVRFYDDKQSEEYLSACLHEFSALTHQ